MSACEGGGWDTALQLSASIERAASAQRQVEFLQMTNWWIELMLATSTPLPAELVAASAD